jgi:hypothetical protein
MSTDVNDLRREVEAKQRVIDTLAHSFFRLNAAINHVRHVRRAAPRRPRTPRASLCRPWHSRGADLPALRPPSLLLLRSHP